MSAYFTQNEPISLKRPAYMDTEDGLKHAFSVASLARPQRNLALKDPIC